MSDADPKSAKLPAGPAQGANEPLAKRVLRRKVSAVGASGMTAAALAQQPSPTQMSAPDSPVAASKSAGALSAGKTSDSPPKFKPTAQAKPRKLPVTQQAPVAPLVQAEAPVAKPAQAEPVAETKVVESKCVEPVTAQAAAAEAQPVEAAPAASAAVEPLVIEPIVVPAPLMASVEAPAAEISPTNLVPTPVFSIKDMTMDMSANFSGFQDAITEAQAKAKAAFEKSSNVLGEVGSFTKGNVEAIVESGKIYASGLQEIGSSLAAEGRTAFETMTGDVKELAAAKSPTDFFKLQSDLVRKSFDNAMSYSTKNSETFLKLMSDAMAPISGRVSLAVEKARTTVSPSAI